MSRQGRFASFGMYPFAQLREPYEIFWAALRERLDVEAALDWSGDVHEQWADPSMLVGQTCGWPLVTELVDRVSVLGTFDVAVPFARNGQYRSVVVAAKPLAIDAWSGRADTVVAVNALDSLSGWVSLCNVWGERPPNVLVTGSHHESMRAVVRGSAQVASIDAVTLEHVVRFDPTMGNVNIIGHGPEVPTLPLVCAARYESMVPELRRALEDTVNDRRLAAVLAALRIRGFVPRDRSAFDLLPLLLPPPSS